MPKFGSNPINNGLILFALSAYYQSICFYFQNGEITMKVQFVAPDSDSDDDNDEIIDENGYRLVIQHFPYHQGSKLKSLALGMCSRSFSFDAQTQHLNITVCKQRY